MKDLAANTTSTTRLKGTPSGSRTRSKTSTAAKRDLIKAVLLNSTSGKLQHVESTQTELLTLIKSLIDKTPQTKPPVMKDETALTDVCSSSISVATSTHKVIVKDVITSTSDTKYTGDPPSTDSQQSRLTAAQISSLPKPTPRNPFIVVEEKHTIPIDSVVADLDICIGATTHFIPKNVPTPNKRNTMPYPDVDNSSSLQKIREVLTSVDANFSLDSYNLRANMYRGDGKCPIDTVDLEPDCTNSYTLIVGGQCDIEAVNTTGPISPFIQSLTDGDILSLSNAVLKTTTLSIHNTSTNPIIIFTFIKASSIVPNPKDHPPSECLDR